MDVKHNFKQYSNISWESVFLWRKLEYHEKKNDLPQFSDKRYYRILYRVHLVTELTTVLVIDTKCNGKCNSNYYAKRVRHRWPFEFTQNLLSYIKNVIKGMFTFDLFFDRFAW